MSIYNVGFNGDVRLLADFNSSQVEGLEHGTSIGSLYWSTTFNPIGSARPIERLPKIEREEFFEICKQVHEAGYKVNLTANAFCLGSLKQWGTMERLFVRFLNSLNGFVDIITIAHPLIAETIVKHHIPIAVEISTILNCDSVSHFTFWKRTLGERLVRVCLPITKNRDFKFLRALVKTKHNDIAELIVNEFCTVGRAPCHGIYRDSCYMGHSHNDWMVAENYPMSRCMAARWSQPSSWIKAPFILPQWIQSYEDEGISHFKITGRTHESEFIRKIVFGYMHRIWTGNLLDLWAQLETIYGQIQEEVISSHGLYLSASAIASSGILDKWRGTVDNFSGNPHSCSTEDCGLTCRICDNLFETLSD
jgi:collagenase-like PrtC family protease